MRTIFTAFHHLDPTNAKAILKNSIDCGEPIGIFEMTERSFFGIMGMLLGGFILASIFIPISRPFSIKKVLVTPFAALMTCWDGIASCLRTYSVKELEALVNEADPSKSYEWKIGRKFARTYLCRITYLIGSKKQA